MTGDPNAADGLLDYASLLAEASPALMLAIFILALARGWLVLPRELVNRQERIHQLEAERDEFKDMAFQALNVGERVASAVEQRRSGR